MTMRNRHKRCGADSVQKVLIGLDVGSTTVKAVVVDRCSGRIVWSDYRRHETRQQETALALLAHIENRFKSAMAHEPRIFATGTGSAAVAEQIGALVVQEVNAVSMAVEKRFPDVSSVIELGGEDAKIILLKMDNRAGVRRKHASMNDKCAGGTGAVIDKIRIKLGISPEVLSQMPYIGVPVHPVAGKCGVFAESDINSLQKQGVPEGELIASLFESLVRQNLSVLARGYTILPNVLLLGGPNTFLRGMQECWRRQLFLLWQERGVALPPDRTLEELVRMPEHALLFAALGAVDFGLVEMEEHPDAGRFQGTERLRWQLTQGRKDMRARQATVPLVKDDEELDRFLAEYAIESWKPPRGTGNEVVDVFIGLDGGSTSTKAVALDCQERVIAKAYRLSEGNPVEDARRVMGELQRNATQQGFDLQVRGVATTGYAKDMLKEVLGADIALVETVAHMRSGLLYHPEADVICDVGGQDIKVILLKNGTVKDFRLNTQCSAGNGFYLQSTAAAFGYPVEEYASAAFSARSMPLFGYGCAVFLQSDIVDFQRQGWAPNEILAGLAAVLPKNIWLYVCQMPNLAQLGSRFVLQGGAQRNLAAVKAQVDFIRDRFRGSEIDPDIRVHRHCGEAGAIGCALEARRRYDENSYATTFIGFDGLERIRYTTLRDESTRCAYCANRCLRTFITIQDESGQTDRLVIVANCEKGAAGDVETARQIERHIREAKKANANLVEVAAQQIFVPPSSISISDALPEVAWWMSPHRRRTVLRRRVAMELRSHIRIGIPRVLNQYLCAPFFQGFFISLGIAAEHIVWSDYTSDALYREGANRGSIDPCYPSKLAIPHVYNLLHVKHAQQPLSYIFFPAVDSYPTWLDGLQASRACPSSVATAESTHAAFTKEEDLFAAAGIRFKKTFVMLHDPNRCAYQLFEDWKDDLGLSEQETLRAVEVGYQALDTYQTARRAEGRAILEQLEKERRLGIVVLARPYHNDPGVHHGILEEFQKRGYPVLTHDALPVEDEVLRPLFGAELAKGDIDSLRSIDDVWKHTFAENSSRKLWAAKFTARHPLLIGLELSSFKCGHDAPTYAAIESIIECAGKPFFYFKDIDENRSAGAIRIRVETITYFLEGYRKAHVL